MENEKMKDGNKRETNNYRYSTAIFDRQGFG